MPTADELISAATIARLADLMAAAEPRRPWSSVRACAAGLDGLGLSERGRAAAAALLADGPEDFAGFAAVVRTALAGPGLSGWMVWPVAEAVAVRALAAPDAAAGGGAADDDSGEDRAFEAGLALLRALTPRLTSEFALRSFLTADLDRTLAAVVTWTGDPDEHVRRLASEGTRLRLPWARQVPGLRARPECTLPILDALYRDPSEYVRRSVANHLNDLSRLDPALAVRIAARWLDSPAATTPRLVRHGMRTLVKQAHPGALALMGFAPPVGLAVTGPRLESATVPIGGELRFDFVLTNTADTAMRLAVDYVIHYRKANGTLSPKVFKLSTPVLAPGQELAVSRRQSFEPLTTRRHHVGPHAVELQVNGQRFNKTPFEVTEGAAAGESDRT